MTRFTRFGPLALGLLLLAAAAGGAAERPYKAWGTAGFTSPTDFAGEGVATHLGDFDEVGSARFSPTDDPTVLRLDGGSTLTAADGDELHEFISADFDLLTGTITGTIRYAGGTGRFAGARGTAALAAQVLPDGSIAFVVEGTIDY